MLNRFKKRLPSPCGDRFHGCARWTSRMALGHRRSDAPGRHRKVATSSNCADAEMAIEEPGTDRVSGGKTVCYFFINKIPNLKLVFRKRALKPGSGIGYHLQKEDEIYYVLSGRGEMTMDGKTFEMKPGDAGLLTRPGASHGFKQIGKEDLVIMINYEQVAVKP